MQTMLQERVGELAEVTEKIVTLVAEMMSEPAFITVKSPGPEFKTSREKKLDALFEHVMNMWGLSEDSPISKHNQRVSYEAWKAL